MTFLDAAVVPAATRAVSPADIGNYIGVTLGDEEPGVTGRQIRLSGVQRRVQLVVRRELEDDGNLHPSRGDRTVDVGRQLHAVAHLDPDTLVGELGVIPRLLGPHGGGREQGLDTSHGDE